jgi:NitT/TauT family transport system ATP-binding protein
MRQRVGRARALAVAPRTLLMDEPFGALDTITRSRLGEELLRVWEQDQRTVVFVTHSLDEALLLSDRVLVMRGGVILRDVPVDLPRPRRVEDVLEDPDLLALRRTLAELL